MLAAYVEAEQPSLYGRAVHARPSIAACILC